MVRYLCGSKTHNLQYSRNILRVIILLVLSNIFVSHSYAADPRTPSQALPKMFRGQASPDYYDLKKQEQILPNLDTKQPITQQTDTGIKIIPETLIILAPKELQNIIDIDNYRDDIVGSEQTVQNLYDLAIRIEREFNNKGYPLVRAFLPTQELEPEQETVFI